MNYLLVFTSNGQSYLNLTEDNSIAAYASKEDLMACFSHFKSWWSGNGNSGRMGYSFYGSATIAMIQMQPVAIKAPEKPEDLIPYIKEQKPYRVSGGAIGRGYIGMPVDSSILELKQFDIMRESMIEGGILDPNQMINQTL